jgi:methylation protein EvaC
MPIANGFLKPENYETEYFFHMQTSFCSHCKMFQLVDQPNPEMMFHENYAFFSSTSKLMTEHFKRMASHYHQDFLSSLHDPFIVELGSNDGIMLKNFSDLGIRHLGVEPSSNVAEVARSKGVNSISVFFGEDSAQKIEKEYGKADIITASNVMCHIPDLASVGKGVDVLLKENGVFVFEDPYLGDVIEKVSYDQIYDEHVYIFSVQSVSSAFSKHGLEIFHVEAQPTHGGSMRYYLGRKGSHAVRQSVMNQLQKEESLGLGDVDTFHAFKNNCERSKKELVDILKKLQSERKRVVGYAATSKSTTVLNYCGIGPDLIEFISDTTPLKQGKFSPGMHIPVLPYSAFKNDYPDYALLFAWNHSTEIFSNEKDFTSEGGKWLVFVPTVQVLA